MKVKEKGVWIPNEWQADKRLSPTDLIILAKVYSYTQNDWGYCWANSDELLPIGNISQSTFDRSKEWLRKLGIFEILKPKSKWRQIKVHLDKLQISKQAPQPINEDDIPF